MGLIRLMPPASSEIAAVRAMLHARPRPATLAERRERLDGLGTQYPLPADVDVEPLTANGVPAEWTRTPGSDPARVIMFLHGGGYISGSLASHRHMIAEAGRQARASTFAVAYRLAPEHPYPAALEDALAAYRFLLARGFSPDAIALAGESAGGGLALATLEQARAAGLPLPACIWCSSPWVDLALTGNSLREKADVDPLISRAYLEELAAAYLHGTDARAPLVSPLYADLSNLPSMLVQVGSAETLLDDSVRLARRAGAQGVRVTLSIWPDMIHAWHLFYQQLSAGRAALAEVGDFVRRCFA
jgi:acetyl esterase/lipase